MKLYHKIIIASAALFALAACQHKDLGWPGESYFDKYREDQVLNTYPTNLMDTLIWPGQAVQYPGQNEHLYHYFFDKDGNLVHEGEEPAFGDGEKEANWKYHIDSVFTDKAGVTHYKGKYSALCSENPVMYQDQSGEYKFLDGELVPEKISVQWSGLSVRAIDTTVTVKSLSFSGMDISGIYMPNVPAAFGYIGYTTPVNCGTTTPPVDDKYETTKAEVKMADYKTPSVCFKIYNNLDGGNTGLTSSKYAFADGMYSVFKFANIFQGKDPLPSQTIYFGCDEKGDWTSTSEAGTYKYTASTHTYKKPEGKLYLFCDFISEEGGEYTVRYRVCKVIDYTNAVTGNENDGYVINVEGGYPTEEESGLLGFYAEYFDGQAWRSDVTYPVTKLIQ